VNSTNLLRLVLALLLSWTVLSPVESRESRVESRLSTEDSVRRILPNGLRVLVQPDRESAFVAICVFVRAGVAGEGRLSGIGNLVRYALFGNNLNQSSETISRAINAAGGNLETVWNPDYTLVTCVTTHEFFEDAFYVIAQALKHAEFDEESLGRARQLVAADVARENADPFRVAYAAIRTNLYRESPYRLPFFGLAESTRRLTREAALRFYHTGYRPENMVVSIAGDVSPERAHHVAATLLAYFDRPELPPSHHSTASPDILAETVRVVRRLPTHTTHVVAGFRAPGLAHPDYPAFAVLSAVIGGGKSSRLFRQVRDTEGVGYIVGAFTPPLVRESHLLAFVEVDSKRNAGSDTGEIEKRLVQTTLSILAMPPTAQEVERARRYVAGTHALAHQRTRDRAFYFGWYEAMGLGYEFDAEFARRVAAVTPEDVARVAKKYLDKYVLAVIMP
jgi:predicted Zn-dependent peptidase